MDPFAANRTPVADDAAIVESYPEPLARAWQRVLIASPRTAFHHRQLLVMAETLTYYVAAVSIAAYEQGRAAGTASDPALNRSLRSLRHVTFGQWLGWARAALAAVPASAAPLPGLGAAYEAGDTGMLLLGYEGLRSLMVVLLGYSGEYGPREAAGPRLFLELINQYQLRLAKHPPGPDSGYDEIAGVAMLALGLRAALGFLHLLAEYPLLGLARAAGAIVVLRLQGLDVGESAVELDPAADPPGTLLLADRAELPMLVLDPWLIYAACPDCGRVQVAAFAGRQDDVLHYAGLDCEHTWTQGPATVLAEVELANRDAPWLPDLGDLPADAPGGAPEESLYARFEAESQALEADRRARRPVPPAPTGSAGPAHTQPGEVYRDLLDQRAAGGLTLDQLQHLDEERAAAEERHRQAHLNDPR